MDTSPLQRQQIVRHAVLQEPTDVLSTTLHLWQCLAQELSAIIGQAGFQSMYFRSLHLSSSRYHFLPSQTANATAEMLAPNAAMNQATSVAAGATLGAHINPPSASAEPFAPLLACLAAQSAEEAGRASIDLLCTFIDILAVLIGEHLTSTILRSAWGDRALDAKEHHE
ncbi:MAG: hypothetical protein HYZ45_04410 [Burkholderiales bacterium]|nr:hypothetical protein [Burkholderiales bacterium]